MLGNVPSMFSNALGRLTERDKETGLSPLMRGAAALDPLIMPSMRGGDAIIRQGQQYVSSQGRNATIAELKKRAEAGDTVAQRYLQGIESGALDMKTGFAGYLNEVAANERAQREMNMRMSLAKASADKKTTYKSMTGDQINKLMGTNLPADKLFNLGSDGKVTQVGGAGINIGGQEKEYEKKMGGFYAERNINMANDAAAAVDALNTIQVQRNLTQDPSFRSGAGQELFNNASSLLAQLGIGEADIASGEAFRAFASQSVLDALGGSLGTGVSNADVTFINNTVANLSNTGAGIQTILDIREKLYRRKLETAELARQWMADNNTQFLDQRWDQYIAKWNDDNPIFPNADSYF